MGFIKKSPALIFEALGAVLAIVGLVLTFMCSAMSEDYALGSMAIYAVEVIVAIALVALAGASVVRDFGRGYVSLASIAVSVFLLVNVAVNVIGARVLLASGLFTWNSANQVGWNVWNSSIVAVVVLFISAVVLVVSAFVPERNVAQED